MVPFSDKESTLLQTAFANLQGGEAALMKMIDFEKTQEAIKYKDVAITKVMFRRVLAKLKGDAGPSKSPKTPTGSKPEGVSKNQKTPTKRGRKKKPVTDVFDSDDDDGEVVSGLEELAKKAGLIPDTEKVDDTEVGIKPESSVVNEAINEAGVVKDEKQE